MSVKGDGIKDGDARAVLFFPDEPNDEAPHSVAFPLTTLNLLHLT